MLTTWPLGRYWGESLRFRCLYLVVWVKEWMPWCLIFSIIKSLMLCLLNYQEIKIPFFKILIGFHRLEGHFSGIPYQMRINDKTMMLVWKKKTYLLYTCIYTYLQCDSIKYFIFMLCVKLIYVLNKQSFYIVHVYWKFVLYHSQIFQPNISVETGTTIVLSWWATCTNR